MSKRPLVKLYYDVLSPYAWAGFEILCRYKSQWNMELDLKPVFLSAIMNSSKNTPPGMVTSKRTYMFMYDLPRIAKFHNIPYAFPSNIGEFMFGNDVIHALRALTIVKETYPNKLESLSRSFFQRIWGSTEAKINPEIIQECLKEVGVSATDQSFIMNNLNSQSTKDKLKNSTNEALEFGAYGVPFMVLNINGKSEPFFGTDRIYMLAAMLGEKLDFPQAKL